MNANCVKKEIIVWTPKIHVRNVLQVLLAKVEQKCSQNLDIGVVENFLIKFLLADLKMLASGNKMDKKAIQGNVKPGIKEICAELALIITLRIRIDLALNVPQKGQMKQG